MPLWLDINNCKINGVPNFNNSVIIQWSTINTHDCTWTFPIAFTQAPKYISASVWLDGIGGSYATNITSTSVVLACDSRHAVFSGVIALGY